MRPCTALSLALVCLCAAGLARASTPAPIHAWSSGSYLTPSSDRKAVPSVQALEELFAGVAGMAGGVPAALAGLLDPQQLAQERPDAVVVVASQAEACSPQVAAQLAELSGAAASHLQLPHAMHEGSSHPVFAGLRRSARRMRVRVLGRCGASTAGSGPATPEALRAELESAAGGEQPTVVVLCPEEAAEAEAGGRDVEAELLAAASRLLAELAPRHLLVHTAHAASAAASQARLERRRQLLEAQAAVASSSSAANRTANYTTCDATCQKHVMWFEGLIVLVVILLALCVGCSCMHMVDVPTRFAQPLASRQHND